MSKTFTEVVTLLKTECGKCGGVFAITDYFVEHARVTAGGYNCPYCGTRWSWSKSEADQLREQLRAANAEIQQVNQRASIEIERVKRQAATANALREEAEQRAAKEARKAKRTECGVCIHCNRSFRALRRHMASAHGIKNACEPKPKRP